MAFKKSKIHEEYRISLFNETLLVSTKHLNAYGPDAEALTKKLLDRIENDPRFFSVIFGRRYNDLFPLTPQVKLVEDCYLVTPEEEFHLGTNEIVVHLPPSMKLYARAIEYMLNCGGFEDKRLTDHEKYLKYNIIEIVDKFLENK